MSQGLGQQPVHRGILLVASRMGKALKETGRGGMSCLEAHKQQGVLRGRKGLLWARTPSLAWGTFPSLWRKQPMTSVDRHFGSGSGGEWYRNRGLLVPVCWRHPFSAGGTYSNWLRRYPSSSNTETQDLPNWTALLHSWLWCGNESPRWMTFSSIQL